MVQLETMAPPHNIPLVYRPFCRFPDHCNLSRKTPSNGTSMAAVVYSDMAQGKSALTNLLLVLLLTLKPTNFTAGSASKY